MSGGRVSWTLLYAGQEHLEHGSQLQSDACCECLPEQHMVMTGVRGLSNVLL